NVSHSNAHARLYSFLVLVVLYTYFFSVNGSLGILSSLLTFIFTVSQNIHCAQATAQLYVITVTSLGCG
ncbi:MAG: hypothetical protein Q8S84_06040, partial [bacterium]|nr:hypothetical protein [bacterium]